MANNEPNKPDKVKITPAQEAKAEEKTAPAKPPEVGGEAPASEITAEKAAETVHEDKSALHEIGNDALSALIPQ